MSEQRNDSRNDSHLPECRYVARVEGNGTVVVRMDEGCICDRLRACEQRVMDRELMLNFTSLDMVRAYQRGLDAAREAVDALQSMTGLLGKADALAAIDALREEQK